MLFSSGKDVKTCCITQWHQGVEKAMGGGDRHKRKVTSCGQLLSEIQMLSHGAWARAS